MQLFGANYFKPQYFNAVYLHGATAVPAQDGRSGYWRLFYYNLQEESLREKRDDQVSAEPTIKDTLVRREDLPAVVVPKRAAPKPSPKPERPPVRERPILRVVATEEDRVADVTPALAVLSMEFRGWLMTSEPLRVAMLQRKAANDEENELIELLLLAA
jgi:hypothetical protein